MSLSSRKCFSDISLYFLNYLDSATDGLNTVWVVRCLLINNYFHAINREGLGIVLRRSRQNQNTLADNFVCEGLT